MDRVSRCIALLAVALIAGCHRATDGELFRSAIDEVQAGDSAKIDARDHSRVVHADLAALAGATSLETLCLDGTSVGLGRRKCERPAGDTIGLGGQFVAVDIERSAMARPLYSM